MKIRMDCKNCYNLYRRNDKCLDCNLYSNYIEKGKERKAIKRLRKGIKNLDKRKYKILLNNSNLPVTTLNKFNRND